MFPVSQKFFILVAVGIFFIVIGVFIYVQLLFLKIDEGRGPLMASDVFECSTLVESKKEAMECFNVFFEKTLANLIAERGEENVSDNLIFMYGEVKEEDIFIFEGTYQIERDGYGTPYYIKDGYIIYHQR